MYKNRFKISINHGDESLVAYVVVLMMFFVTYMSSLSLLVISSRMALQVIQVFALVFYIYVLNHIRNMAILGKDNLAYLHYLFCFRF